MMRPMGDVCDRYCSKSFGPERFPQVRQRGRHEFQHVAVGVDHRMVELLAYLL